MKSILWAVTLFFSFQVQAKVLKCDIFELEEYETGSVILDLDTFAHKSIFTYRDAAGVDRKIERDVVTQEHVSFWGADRSQCYFEARESMDPVLELKRQTVAFQCPHISEDTSKEDEVIYFLSLEETFSSLTGKLLMTGNYQESRLVQDKLDRDEFRGYSFNNCRYAY